MESTSWRDCHRQGRNVDVETAVPGADRQDGGSQPTRQQDGAVDLQRAVAGFPPAWMPPGRYGLEKHQLDVVLICTKRRRRRSSLPPQDRTCTGGNPEQEGKERDGGSSPRGRDLLEQRWSRGANMQRLCRLLRCASVAILHVRERMHDVA